MTQRNEFKKELVDFIYSDSTRDITVVMTSMMEILAALIASSSSSYDVITANTKSVCDTIQKLVDTYSAGEHPQWELEISINDSDN